MILTVDWPNPAEAAGCPWEVELPNKPPPKPVACVPNKLEPNAGVVDCPNADADCCPNIDGDCAVAGEDWNNPADWVLPNAKPEPKAGVDAEADDDPKGVDAPKTEFVVVPKRGEELAPNAEPVDDPNNGAAEVEPNGLDEVDPKGELNAGADDDEPKVDAFWPNIPPLDEKVLVVAGTDDWPKVFVEPKGFVCDCVEKPIPAAGCPAGFGPPDTKLY